METPDSLDFFAGGVPAGAIFQSAAKDIRRLFHSRRRNAIGNTLEEVCFIGLVSYFESFCKDCFASLINIAPQLLRHMKSQSYDTKVDSLAALEMQERLSFQIGFLVAEGFDFGNAKKINALYSSLIGITPFSKKQQRKYDLLLADRNLIVHNGGIFTHSYLRQRMGVSLDKHRAFMDSLIVDTDYVETQFTFLYSIAKKIVQTSMDAMSAQIASGEITINPQSKRGLKMFNWWDED